MLKGKAKLASDFILDMLEKIAPNSGNKERYQVYFNSMSESDFASYIARLKSGEQKISIALPVNANKVDIERNIDLAKELGYDFYQYIWTENEGVSSRTNEKFLILDLPVRRVSQMLSKKARIPKNYNTVDMLTGQPTGESKGAKISYPELQLCAAMGLDNSMIELMKYRGGDLDGYTAFSNVLINYGRARQELLKNFASTVKSTITLKNYLNAIHIRTESLV